MGRLSYVTYAGFWIRLAASLFDAIIVSVWLSLLWLMSPYAGPFLHEIDGYVLYKHGSLNLNHERFKITLLTILQIVLFLVVPLFYYVYYPASKHKGTFGKQMFGLIIVDDDQFTSGSKQIGLRQSMKRYFAFLIPIVTIVGLYFLPFLLVAIGFKKRKRGYHDEIANTVVIYKNSYSSSPQPKEDQTVEEIATTEIEAVDDSDNSVGMWLDGVLVKTETDSTSLPLDWRIKVIVYLIVFYVGLTILHLITCYVTSLPYVSEILSTWGLSITCG